LADSERRYRFLTDAVPQLVWTADPAGALDYCNRRCLEFTNLPFDALKGDGWLGIVHSDDREATASAWREAVRTGGAQYRIEHRMRHRDGGWRWMLTSAVPLRDSQGTIRKWFGSSTDIHDRVIADEKLRQAQRLHAVGKLAGGMAHEVNNMMTAVIGFGSLALSALGPDHPQRHDVEEMIKAGNRAAEVSRQLLAFSRQQVLRPVVLDVNTVVTELVPALERLLGADRRLEVIATRVPVRVIADRGQVEQVLINLVANARDATATDGVVIVETGAVVVNASGRAEPGVGELEPGQFVRLAVRDNGAGMAPDTVARAFEPFFTTKTVGQGTGLGLSMVYGIVKQSGGYARIESAEGVGTAVGIYLPLVDAEVTTPAPAEAAPRGRSETILVVEDEAMVRSFAFAALRHAGYVVFQAPNGSAALKFLEGHPGQVDLVLTDIVMPRMTGRDLAEAIWARQPGLPILFMSGYSDDEVIRRGVTLAGANFISKPFTIDALATAVRVQLDRARQTTASQRDSADAGPA
jgi:two-component system cell cycle sensor histidine kinase/response regulator CckA